VRLPLCHGPVSGWGRLGRSDARNSTTRRSVLAALLRPDAAGIGTAVRILRRGGVVGMPTETVYGLAADALDPLAVARIFRLKGRPADNPLIVHLSSAAQLGRVVATSTPLADVLAARFWPGPLTLVLDVGDGVPEVTTGGLRTVAVRVPDHPVAAELLAAFGGPLAAPSANRSGRPSPTTAEHVAADLGDDLEVVLDGGPCPVGVESTVVDARGTDPIVLREGSISREDLQVAVDRRWAGDRTVPVDPSASPGTRYRHYAPSCTVEIAAPRTAADRAAALAATGLRVGLVATAPAPEGVHSIARFEDATDLAQRLYAALRAAELAGVDILVVESVPEAGVGRAVMDRLRRAAD
jgi:L-threonylcarbamoyladenylate synthase